MKKLFGIILAIAVVVALLFANNIDGDFIKSNLSRIPGLWNEFKTEYESYRIFNGDMMGEHNVDKMERSYYSDSFYNQLSPNEKAVYDSVLGYDFSGKSVVAVLPEPVFFYSDGAEPTDAEIKSASLYLSRTYQRALDALTMDGDDAFYIQLGEGGSMCKYEYKTVFKGDRYIWCVDKIETEIAVKDCYSNPLDYKEKTHNAASAFIPKGDTRYQKVKSIHDYVVSITIYEDTPYADDAYGVLVKNRATCSGFSRAFKLICDKNNIPCALVTGVGITPNESGEHMWCLVQMEDGLWYGVDPTWDDYGGSEYLLVGGNTVSAFSGITFSESHLPQYDFTGFGYEPFVYPSLADSSYLSVE